MATPSAWLRALTAGSALFLATSCYYDGYYSSGYSGYSGYGGYSDYGYSSGGVTFVYTSSDRWFYDPDLFCYYDRHRHCYYDPYLGGYYPRGYCPRPVYGLPHPGGWSPGRGHCPPPSNFRDRYLSNYDNRVAALRSRNESWSSRVQVRNTSNLEGWRSTRLQQARNFRGTASTPYKPQPSNNNPFRDDRRGSSNPAFRQDNPNSGGNSWFGRPSNNNNNNNNPGNSGGRWGGSGPSRLNNRPITFNPDTNRTPPPRPSYQPENRPTPSRQGWERADRLRENRETFRQRNESERNQRSTPSNNNDNRPSPSSGRDALRDRFRDR